MKLLLATTLLVFILFPATGIAQSPAWIPFASRNATYPDDKYLTAFKSQTFDKKEDSEKILSDLIMLSRSDISDQIRINIQSTASYQVQNVNSVTNEIFKLQSQSLSEASLSGLKTETYLDKKESEVYVLSFIKISDLLQQCSARAENTKQKLVSQMSIAERLSSESNLEEASNAYNQCYPLLRSLENDGAIMAAYGDNQINLSFSELETNLRNGVSNFQKNRSFTLDEVVFLIAKGLYKQMEAQQINEPVEMGSFSFQDTKAGSSFSLLLSESLSQKMTKNGFQILQNEYGKILLSDQRKKYSVIGTYWEEYPMLKLVVNIYQKPDNIIVASMEEKMSIQWFSEHRIIYKPENLELALQRQNELEKNDFISDDLNIDVWTNRGTELPTFGKDDSMFIYMTANKPCFLRLIYLLADGEKTLLIDNFRVSEDMTNKIITYPEVFICDEPFGSEVIQVMAQTAPFEQLRVYQQYGYTMIKDDVPAIMMNYRGMRKADQSLQQAQKRIFLTTVLK